VDALSIFIDDLEEKLVTIVCALQDSIGVENGFLPES
jgi:hypothetical protein